MDYIEKHESTFSSMTGSAYFRISLYLLSVAYILNAFLSFLGYRKEADISLTLLFLLSLALSAKEWKNGLRRPAF